MPFSAALAPFQPSRRWLQGLGRTSPPSRCCKWQGGVAGARAGCWVRGRLGEPGMLGGLRGLRTCKSLERLALPHLPEQGCNRLLRDAISVPTLVWAGRANHDPRVELWKLQVETNSGGRADPWSTVKPFSGRLWSHIHSQYNHWMEDFSLFFPTRRLIPQPFPWFSRENGQWPYGVVQRLSPVEAGGVGATLGPEPGPALWLWESSTDPGLSSHL